MIVEHAQKEYLRDCLCALQKFVLRSILDKTGGGDIARLSSVVEQTASDTIFGVDSISEAAILTWFAENWPAKWPVELVMEGLEGGRACTYPMGTPVDQTQLKCLIDPIDGTRGLMFDKRSAWILCGLAPQRHAANRLSDIFVAAMTEIPTTRQWRADQISAIQGGPAKGISFDVRADFRSRSFQPKPSAVGEVAHAFAGISRFFPEAAALLGRCEERLWEIIHGPDRPQGPLVFNDQYIATGGQFYELMCGHDLFLADLRPLAFQKLGISQSLACHPYDVSAAAVLTAAGCVLEDADGTPLDPPMDLTTPVAWVGYANPRLAAKIRPALHQTISELLR